MSSSSSSAGGSHAGLALAATAMALSGTLVLFSLCRANKPPHHDDAPARLRPCLSSSEKRKREKARRGSKKRVRFAADVVDNDSNASSRPAAAEPSCRNAAATAATAMPANREALYRGMLRGRSMLRVACSY
ncbi:uncharacterized protein [Oryza sativa Japonica Group]|jgi:hypothetical protein|uniref:Os06g0604600 protein n=7 Tax=Oryza TaxID=4527 RepID=A3BDD8_ORYSJ|nr:uncharacterized protein LOC4341471 [Oryza sativa Japonica Group]XP_052158192.1 uncharacterized protein LOC127775919 [Oryza glaberrima]EAZ01593.1 hypothetical protein OsI_23627 [Oryza sativa Indica Group]KAB8103015.1 hypothetical protein EE612_035203 [Oryza sativa]EAZ01594.1 hypothetical protein OsI_23629 [Oryza sativa Indica Group]EAZ37577.1 hypothetical protein OsJ_21909 [Oryza sativa Japonica Group]KAF2927464.1 hypothetical protein DAI22_06g207600 [Oryza sativa Japonica Group]|eukprot:NP_001058019.1 Os06g0604600 [Oryza sativa Japonica Group]